MNAAFIFILSLAIGVMGYFISTAQSWNDDGQAYGTISSEQSQIAVEDLLRENLNRLNLWHFDPLLTFRFDGDALLPQRIEGDAAWPTKDPIHSTDIVEFSFNREGPLTQDSTTLELFDLVEKDGVLEKKTKGVLMSRCVSNNAGSGTIMATYNLPRTFIEGNTLSCCKVDRSDCESGRNLRPRVFWFREGDRQTFAAGFFIGFNGPPPQMPTSYSARFLISPNPVDSFGQRDIVPSSVVLSGPVNGEVIGRRVLRLDASPETK